MTAGTEAKENNTVEMKEPPKHQMRFFALDESVVDIPEAYREKFTDAPKSITITVMTPHEAEARRRLKERIQTEQVKANTKAGIKQSEVLEMQLEHGKILERLELLQENEEEYRKKYGISDDVTSVQEVERVEESIRERFSDMIDKKNAIDKTLVYEAVDALEENTKTMIKKHLVSLNFEDRKVLSEEIPEGAFRGEFEAWLIYTIEDESYLSDTEVLGL